MLLKLSNAEPWFSFEQKESLDTGRVFGQLGPRDDNIFPRHQKRRSLVSNEVRLIRVGPINIIGVVSKSPACFQVFKPNLGQTFVWTGRDSGDVVWHAMALHVASQGFDAERQGSVNIAPVAMKLLGTDVRLLWYQRKSFDHWNAPVS